MASDIFWVKVGSTGGHVTDSEIERVGETVREELADDDDYVFTVGEDINLFDLDTLKDHVDRIEELVEE